ncbi:hypothetical protein K474DRAFT_1704143 [Panus rudis PR-1116 ss-1]|nr:hypothetical protein K474DRAFT_1704143 [Panus rudis PR-1116 ss-1]
METAHMEPALLDHKPGDFVDPTGNNFYDALGPLEYLQYPHSPFGVGSMNLPPSSSPRMGFNSLNISNGMSEYTYGPSTSFSNSPGRSYTPTGIFPGALNGDLSSDSLPSGRSRRGSGAGSPGPAVPPGNPASIPRSHRFNPMAATVTRSSTRQQKKRAKGSDDFDSDDGDDYVANASNQPSDSVRREEIRRQRIESEQRRRDELRDGYRRLKEALPVSNQKSSKVSLLDRATTHIRYLEMTQNQLQTRLAQAEAETQRLRHVNEALMLGTAEQRHAAAASAVVAAQSQAF